MIMKKQISYGVSVLALLVMFNTQVSAQGFLKKLSKAADKVTSTASAVTGSESSKSEADTAEVKALKWDQIPVYKKLIVTLTNEDGSVKLNDDGTPMKRVFLVDQFGNKRSAEAVKEQHKKLNKAIGRILLKVGGGAAVGVAGGLLASKGDAKAGIVGGVAGAGVGLALSAKDIKEAKAQKKSLKEQEKLVETYSKTFTAEGIPVDASIDLANVDGIDFTKGDTISQNAEALKKELASSDFNSSDDSAWNV